MNAKQGAIIGIVVLLIVVGLVASAAGLFSPAPNSVSFTVPASAVRAPLHESASNGRIALRLNGISDASNPATQRVWVTYSLQSYEYNFSLTPAPGDRYLVANVTVTNERQTDVPFSYTHFVLLSPDNAAYYANYGVCGYRCSASVLLNRTLSGRETDNLYVLFSVPAGTQAAQLVYPASTRPIVLSSS